MISMRFLRQSHFFFPAGLVSLLGLGTFFLVNVYPHSHRTGLTSMEIHYDPSRFAVFLPKLNYIDTISISPDQLASTHGIGECRSKLLTFLHSSDSLSGLVIPLRRDCKYNDFVELCDMLNLMNLPFELDGSTIKAWKPGSDNQVPGGDAVWTASYPPGYPFSTSTKISEFLGAAVSTQLSEFQRELVTIPWATTDIILIISWTILFVLGVRNSRVQFENRRIRRRAILFATAPNTQNSAAQVRKY